MAGIDEMISARQFAKSPTFDFGDSKEAAKANINDLIADTYAAQEAIADGKTPYAAVRDNIPYPERGSSGVGYGITYSSEPKDAIVIKTKKDAEQPVGEENARIASVTYDAADATQKRVRGKREAAKKEASEKKAKAKAEEEAAKKDLDDRLDKAAAEVTERKAQEEEEYQATRPAWEKDWLAKMAQAVEEKKLDADMVKWFLEHAPEGMTSDKTETPKTPTRSLDLTPQEDKKEFKASQTAQQEPKDDIMRSDINARMGAWKQATDHPERVSEFLRGFRVVNDKGIDAVKDSISPNGEIKESANETDPNEFMPAMADAAAEEGPDDFEAPGIKHMKDTKKERADAIRPVTSQVDKIHGAEEVGRDVGRGDVDPKLTAMDVDVDTSAYLESLMDKGLITPEQYVAARERFKEGRDAGLAGY